MKSMLRGAGLLLVMTLAACSKITPVVDTYGFKQAFEHPSEEEISKQVLGKESAQLATDILKAIQANAFDQAHSKLQALRRQSDLTPRQRLESKALETKVFKQLNPSPENQTVSQSNDPPTG